MCVDLITLTIFSKILFYYIFSLAASHNLCEESSLVEQRVFWIYMSVVPPSGQMVLSASALVKRIKLLFHDKIKTVFRLK